MLGRDRDATISIAKLANQMHFWLIHHLRRRDTKAL
jgi:hypothetical protein